LLALASNELVQAQDQLVVLGRKKATERVVTFLIKMAERIGRQDNDGWELDLPMTRTDMADYLGLSTESVSRTMSRLRKAHLILTPGIRSVYIRDPGELALHSGDL
jgi:CRP/FNR family transcriptional regulator